LGGGHCRCPDQMDSAQSMRLNGFQKLPVVAFAAPTATEQHQWCRGHVVEIATPPSASARLSATINFRDKLSS